METKQCMARIYRISFKEIMQKLGIEGELDRIYIAESGKGKETIIGISTTELQLGSTPAPQLEPQPSLKKIAEQELG